MRKNYRKIPPHIFIRLERLRGENVVAGCAISITREQLISGQYSQLGIQLNSDGISVAGPVLPNPSSGKYSRWNMYGKVLIHKELPKVRRVRSMDAPNWGGEGTHSVDIPYLAYQREFLPPPEVKLVLHCANPSGDQGRYILAVKVDEVLNRNAAGFRDRLLYDINILQENIAACGVELAESELSSYVQSLHVTWEILPPGNLEDALTRLFSRRTPTQVERNDAAARYAFFASLNPEKIIIGASGFSRYFGAKITDNIVVFENIKYGNAVYVLFDDWGELSRKSRMELLSGRFGENFERVVHSPGWEEKVRKIIQKRLQG